MPKYPRSEEPQRCTKCGEIKPAEGFYSSKHSPNGLRGDCKECRKSRRRNRHKSHKYSRSEEPQQCIKCRKVKLAKEFHTNRSDLNGLQSMCMECRKNRPKYPRSEEPQRCAKCGEIKPAEEFHTHSAHLNGLRSTCIECRRVYKRACDYGLTREAYSQMLQRQDNKCAICHKTFTKVPHVDHCHESEKVRGLLCSGCNLGLGCFKDDPAILANAIKYLEAADA